MPNIRKRLSPFLRLCREAQRGIRGTALALMVAASASSPAALRPGAQAPDFSAQAAVGGQAFAFNLAASLKKGPVVLYFYPKAFTSGCTVEAHQFAEASAQFKALGAEVIGMSNDNIETLKKFSVEACRNKFAVAGDAGGQVMKAYDAEIAGSAYADRISYAISPEGKILAVHASMDPDGHVAAMLDAVTRWRASRR